MLHYCSVDDINQVFPSAGRYLAYVDTVRQAVTSDINMSIRRNLEYAPVTDYFESRNTHNMFDEQKLWLTKKNIDTTMPLVVCYSSLRDWDDNVIDPAQITVNAEEGWITVVGYTRYSQSGFRVSYYGGYPPIVTPADPNDPDSVAVATDVMDCLAGLRAAAIQEAVYRLNASINLDTGQDQDTKGNTRSLNRSKKVGNLLSETANAINPWRKPLGR